jgi:dolichyl-phosphate-mannose-protein mannosyltransferase
MYNQSIRLQHKDTSAFLHSYNFTYPHKYETGRYSSQGKNISAPISRLFVRYSYDLMTGTQVVGNMNPDINSYWRILPAGNLTDEIVQQYVKHDDIIRLEHIATGMHLMTHDVASPWTTTNQEITTTNLEIKYNKTLFKVVLDDLTSGQVWSTTIKPVNLVHVETGVGLLVNNRNLPDWGFFHLEVNGNKQSTDKKNFWVATDILGINGKYCSIYVLCILQLISF